MHAPAFDAAPRISCAFIDCGPPVVGQTFLSWWGGHSLSWWGRHSCLPDSKTQTLAPSQKSAPHPPQKLSAPYPPMKTAPVKSCPQTHITHSRTAGILPASSFLLLQQDKIAHASTPRSVFAFEFLNLVLLHSPMCEPPRGATRAMRPCYVTLRGAAISVCANATRSAELRPRLSCLS